MRALHYVGPHRLEWRDVTMPQIESPTDVIVRPTAVAACDLDRGIFSGKVSFQPPFVLGHEFCGEVLQIGEDIHSLRIGDRVVASFQPSCGHCSYCKTGHSSVCGQVPKTSMYGVGAHGGDWGGAMSEAVRVPWGEFNLRKIPAGIDATAIASGSDNLLDGLRAVDAPLAAMPGATVLVTGSGSIALYGLLAAAHLGAGKMTFASPDAFALGVAEALGAECIHVTDWPRRFDSHDITFDCTGSGGGLSATIRSTSPFGTCTSASMFFEPIPMPLLDMYMKGIVFKTGRVDSASQLDRMLELVQDGLDPREIQPGVASMTEAQEMFANQPVSQKLIFTPGTA